MKSSIKHTIALLGTAVLIVVIVPLLLAIFKNSRAANIQNSNVANANASATTETPLYYAEKIDTTTTVYSQASLTSGTHTELFHFTERYPYESSTNNGYAELRPSVAYDAVNKKFAYASTDGLFLYDVATKATTGVITKTGESGETVDGITIPIWSDTSIPGVFFLFHPQFSTDGNYLSVVGAYYEGTHGFVINMSTQSVTTISGAGNQYIGGNGMAWSQIGHNITIGTPDGPTAQGVFVVTGDDFTAAKNVLAADMPNVEPTASIFVGTEQVAYSYTANTSPNKNVRTASSIHLALINTDGSGQSDLVTDGADNVPVASSGDQIIYKKTDVGDPSRNGFWLYDLATGTDTLLVLQQESHVLSAQLFNAGTFSYIDSNSTTNTSILYELKPDTLDVTYASLQTAQGSGLYYMGLAD